MAKDAVQIFLLRGTIGLSAMPASTPKTPVAIRIHSLLSGRILLTSNLPAMTPKMVLAAEEMQLMVAYEPLQCLCRIRPSRYQPILPSFTHGPTTPGAWANWDSAPCSARNAHATPA